MSIPESFWTEDKPIGEVLPEQLNAVIHKAIEKVGTDIWRDERLILDAARELYMLSTAGVEFGSDVWLDVQARMFDAVARRFPILAPRALTVNRATEAERLDLTGLARAVLSGGAS